MKPAVLVGAIGVVTAVMIGYNAIYVPHQAQIGVIRAQIAQEQAKQQTRTNVAALLEQLERYRARLPQEPDSSWLVHELMGLAQQAGVPVTSITQSPPQTFESFTRLAATLTISASYHQLGALVDAIERSPHVLRVESVRLTPSQVAEQAKVELGVSTVYVPPITPATPST